MDTKPGNADPLTDASRRSFMRIMGAGAMGAVAMPILTEAHFAWAQTATPTAAHAAAPRRFMRAAPPADAVLINANENPLGPCKAACEAISAIGPKGGRYDFDGEGAKLTQVLSSQLGLKPEYIAVYAGSSEPLHYTTLAFTGPSKSFVSADPSYEAGVRAAAISGATVHFVPLTAEYAHDVKAMVAADSNAGLLYICNPNNPTGTITSREDILWALANKPAGAILLVDEAYIHLSDAHSVMDQVAAGKDLIVLRTFSKIYGMAGIRCGYAAGRPDLLAKLEPYGMNAMPVTALAAAHASLLDESLIPTRKKIIGDTRNNTFAWLKENSYSFIPSQSNCFMIDVKRPGREVIAAMQQKKVFIGRTWGIWPNSVRVSVGTPEEMAKFKVAFKEVMSAPASATAGLSGENPFNVPFSHLG